MLIVMHYPLFWMLDSFPLFFILHSVAPCVRGTSPVRGWGGCAACRVHAPLPNPTLRLRCLFNFRQSQGRIRTVRDEVAARSPAHVLGGPQRTAIVGTLRRTACEPFGNLEAPRAEHPKLSTACHVEYFVLWRTT